jgi:thiol-disulfide isomerase/thioredoxin
MKNLGRFILAMTASTVVLLAHAEPAKPAVEAPKECNDTDKTYKICSDQSVPYKSTLEKAKAEGKLVLLSFGADWCPWCQALHKFYGTPAFRKDFDSRLAIDEVGVYRYDGRVKIDSGMNILKGLVESNGKDMKMVDGYPFLVMVRPSDKKAVFIATGGLEDNTHGKGHDPAKVKAALNNAIAQLKN